MKSLLALMIAISIIALVCPVLAQPGPGGGGGTEPGGGLGPKKSRRIMGPHAERQLMRLYNPQTVTTVKGAVESLGTMPPSGGPTATHSAVLKTDRGNITVYLGPDWYLDQQKISLKAGDKLAVTGSKVTLGGQPSIIAKDLKKGGGKTITLRDDKGVPVWLGQRPPNGPAK
ncbi:MAG: hypothetical protein ABIG94_02045 [Pseudomonadota bacterium]